MIKDYIKVFEDIVPISLCDAICNEFCDSDEWDYGAVGGRVDKYFRSNKIISLSHVIDKNKKVREKLDAGLFKAAGMAIENYLNIFPYARVERDSGYDLLRYETGQYINQHVDFSQEQFARSISCSFTLNDEYEGGEFAFFDRQIVTKMPKGSAVLFPSNFMFPHEVLPVLSGTRYAVITWFI